MDQRPVNIIEGKGFRKLMNVIEPRYKVISRNTCLENFIVPLYHKTVAAVKSELDSAVNHSFTTDAWTNRSMSSFITTTVSYINPKEFTLKSFVLDTLHVTDRHTSDNLSKFLGDVEEKWNLRDVIGISDNASNIQSAFAKHGIPHFGCFAHTINLAVSKGLEDRDNSVIKRLIGRARSLVSTFRHSYIKTEDLRKNEQLLDLQQLQLVTDVCTRWNSVYYMIKRLLDVYPAIYGALYASPDKHLLLGDEDRKNLEELTEILQPFEKATRMVSSEKEPTAGLILPYLENFIEVKLKENETDSNMVKRFKRTVRADLQNRYKDPDQRMRLALITVLDPRVRTCDWMDDEMKETVYAKLEEACIAERVQNSENEPPRESDEGAPGAAKRVKPNDDLDGVIKVSGGDNYNHGKSDQEIIEKEISEYKNETSYGLGYADSLKWWKLNAAKYPNITKVMLKNLHIPASSVASERVFSTAGRIHTGRENLTPENANIMIFLYHNFKMD